MYTHTNTHSTIYKYLGAESSTNTQRQTHTQIRTRRSTRTPPATRTADFSSCNSLRTEIRSTLTSHQTNQSVIWPRQHRVPSPRRLAGLPPEAELQWGVAGGTHEHVWDAQGAAGPDMGGSRARGGGVKGGAPGSSGDLGGSLHPLCQSGGSRRAR